MVDKIEINRRQALMGASVLGAGMVAAMASGKVAWAAEDKVLRVQNDKDISILDPASRSGWWEENVMFAVLNGLVQYKTGEDWGWRLDIAEAIDDSDPTAIKFRLKPGVMWTNGYGELTAEDVKFSYERIGNPANKADYQLDWAPLTQVEIVDKYNGVIRLNKPFPPLFKSTLPHGSGLIVCKAAVEKNGGKITTDPFATSGPYKIGEWQPHQKLTLVRNELWKGEQPYFDRIEIIPITDLKTAEIGFDSGDIDITKISMSSVPQVKQAADPNVVLNVFPAFHYTWLGMNVENPKLKDIRVRRAIQQAVDVDAVLQAAYFGQAKRAFGIVPPPIPGYRTKNIYGYDPAAAKKLLAEAGVKDLSLRIDLPADTDRITMAQVIQSQLKEVGIDLQVNPMDRGAFEEEGMQEHGDAWKNMELFIVEFSTAPDASWTTAWFTCDQVGVWNWQRTCDKSFDALNQEATFEKDETKRNAAFVKLQDMLEETGAYVFLTHGSNVWLNHPSLKPGFSPGGHWLFYRDTKKA